MRYDEVLKALERKSFRPVYIIDSPESLFRDELFSRLVATFFADTAPNVRSFRAREENDYGKMINEITTVSLFSPRRIVKIAECFAFLEKHLPWLEEYMERTSPGTDTIVYMEDDSSALPRNRLTRDTVAALRTLSGRFDMLVETPDIRYRNKVCSWLVSRASSVHGIRLGKNEAALLVENTGTGLKRLDMELEKLALFVHPRRKVSGKDVRTVCTFNRDNTVYEMLDAVSAGEMGEAVKYLENLVVTGMHPVRILTGLFYHVRKLLYAAHLRARGVPPDEIASRAGVHPYFKKKFLAQAGAFPPSRLEAALALVERADALSKGGSDARRTIERLVMILCLRHERPEGMLRLL